MVLRIFKIIAASGFLAALECTKFVFGRCSAAAPQWGAYSAPPDPLVGLMGPTSEAEERGREGPAPFRKFLDPPLSYTIFSCMCYVSRDISTRQCCCTVFTTFCCRFAVPRCDGRYWMRFGC